MSLIIFLALALGLFFTLRFCNSAIHKLGAAKDANIYRVRYIAKTVQIGVVIFYAVLVGAMMGIEYSQVSFFLSSMFAVLGVALFAQWSILSNVTASLIIFFGFPYRVGDKIKIMDKDDDIRGIIEEITLFHVVINRDGEMITYPNSLILQKGVIKNPEQVKINQMEKEQDSL